MRLFRINPQPVPRQFYGAGIYDEMPGGASPDLATVKNIRLTIFKNGDSAAKLFEIQTETVPESENHEETLL